MFDAYSVKKIIPRAVIAVIGIQLSWYIFTALIEVINLTAYSIEGIIYAPFGGASKLELADLLSRSTNAGGNGLFLAGLTAGSAAAIGTAVSLGGIGFLGLSCLLAVFSAFLLLMIRKVVIVLLLIISPLALVAWILPSTDKYFKLWWESFSKLLLLYPMILAVVAMGRVFAWAAATQGTGNVVVVSNIAQVLIIIIGCFGPFFLIPKLFTLAGSAFGNISGMVNNRQKGAFDRLRNARQNKQKQNLEAIKSGHRFKSGNDTNFLGRVNKGMQYGSHVGKAGLRPSKMRANLATAVGASTKQEIEKNLKENSDYATWANNDDLNKFASASNNESELRAALTKSGMYKGRELAMNEDIARVERVRKNMSGDAFRQMTVQQAIAGGTAYKTTGEQWAAAAAAAGNDEAALADIVAKGRSSSMSAGRVDAGGAGFFDTFDTARKIRDGELSVEEANSFLHGKVLASQGPGVLAHSSMKKGAVEQLVPAMKQQLKEAIESKDTDRIDRQLATVASVYDSMAASSPQNAAVLADQLLRWDPGSDGSQQPLTPGAEGPIIEGYNAGNSIQNRIAARRGSSIFQSTRRELNQTEQLQGQVGGGAVGNNPPNPNPGQM